MRVDNNFKKTNFNSPNKAVSFNGKLEVELPQQLLKKFDAYNNYSGKDLKSLKSFVGFVKNYVRPAVKLFTSKDDVYKLKFEEAHQSSNNSLQLNFIPGQKSQSRGLEPDSLAYVDTQVIRLNKVGLEKLKILKHLFYDRSVNKIQANIDALRKHQANIAKQNDLKLRERLLK
ncbi:MAG: hypothetical protein WCF95_06225 [bacterium]